MSQVLKRTQECSGDGCGHLGLHVIAGNTPDSAVHMETSFSLRPKKNPVLTRARSGSLIHKMFFKFKPKEGSSDNSGRFKEVSCYLGFRIYLWKWYDSAVAAETSF